MKAFYCLLALSLFGWATSDHAFKTGKSYRYQVRGRLMNGLTEISTQYAGLEMDYKLILTVIGENTVNFKPLDMKFFEVNDVIKGGWRDGEFRNPTPVELTQEIRQWLESPMDVLFNKGVVESIKVQGDLPNWVVNMKKAMASHFVIDTTGVNLSMEGNLNRKTGHELPEEKNLESGFHYETLEKTIHGECSTYYTVSQNGAFNEQMPFGQQHQPGVRIQEDGVTIQNIMDQEIVGELPWHQTWHKFCHENDQVYEIIKTVNFTSCVNKPVLSFMAPSMSLDARSGDNHFGGSMGLRTLVSRFLACGLNREEFTILRVHQEEQVKVGLHATKKIMTGAIKNLTLIEITEAVTPAQVNNPKVINTLVYKFVPVNQEKTMEKMMEMPQMDSAYMMNFEESVEDIKMPIMDDVPTVLPKPTLTEAPVNPMLITPLKTEGMKKRVVVLIREIVQDILNKNHDAETLAEKETLTKISIVAKILRYFNLDHVTEIYRQIATKVQTEEDKITRQVFFDCVSMAGTNPNIKLIFDLIQKREIVGDEVARILMTLPMYIRTPTVELLKEYFNLLQSEVLRGQKQAKTTAVLSFSTIIYEACVNTRIRNSRYPVAIYGKFCDAQVVEQEFLPYFVKELERVIKTEEQTENTHWKLVYLTALGNIGHPASIPVIQRYMDNVQNTVVKTRVIFALKHMIIARSNEDTQEVHQKLIADRDFHDILTQKVVKGKVMPILLAAAFDKGEHPDVRMAAITLIFHSSAADKTVFQQLAYLTWFPVSRQVHSFIYHSLKNMAAIEKPIHPVHHQIQTIAREVLSICKPVTLGYQSSRTIFNGNQITEFLTGYFSHFEYFGSKDSIVPNMVYYRNFYQFGGEHGLGSNPIEFTLYGNTLQKLWTHLAEKFIQPSVADGEAHEDLAKIHDLLSIKDRKQQEKVEGYFYLKIRNEMERFVTVNKEVIEQWTKNVMGELLPKLHQGLPINFQKTLHLAEYTQEFPSIFGLPLNYKHRMPVHFSIRGNLKLATEENMKDFQIQAELHPVYAWKTHDKLSVKVPFLNKKYETGLQNHLVAQFPFRALIRKAPRNQVTIAITPTHIHEQTPNSELNLITVHRVPYTAVVVDECWPIQHAEAGRVKAVRVLETPYKNERRYGEKSFGLSFHFEEESDFTVEAEGKSEWIHFFTRFTTPMTYFNLGWLGAPSTRWAKRSLKLDMAQSQTKTFAVVVGGNWWWNRKNVDNMETVFTETTQDNTNERVVKDEHVFVAAFIGKKNPIRPLTSTTGIQKILVKGTPSTFHYLAHFAYAKGIHGKFNLRLVAGEACKDAVAKFPENIESLVAIREYIMDSHVESQQVQQCFEVLSKWEVPTWANPRELLILRKRLLAQDLIIKKNTQFRFGENCNQMPHIVKATAEWKRAQKMTEWALTKSPEAKKCIEDERKGFPVSPVCLWVSEHQAAALNVADIEIEHTEMPVWFKNVTYKVEDFFKAYLYTYVQHNRFPGGGLLAEKKMKVHFEMSPNKEFVTFHFIKPTGHIEWRKVKTNILVKTVLPFTVTQTPLENIKDRTFQFYSEQSCTVEGKYVSTFDNVTYHFGDKVATGCTHLLTKDCTGKYPIAVLVKDIHTEKKVVTVLVGGKNKIVITPLTAFMGLRKGNFKVLLNNQLITEFPKTIYHPQSHEFIATVELMMNGGVQVLTHRVKVATDGVRVALYGHNDLKNRLCGICGNADFESNAELRSPKNCPLSNGELLVASYSFDSLNADESRGQCQVRPEIKAQIEKENADCVQHSTHNVLTMNGINEMTSSEEYNQFDAETYTDDCNVRERLVKRFPGVGVCYSEKPIHQCMTGCYAQNTIQKEVLFKCYQKSNPTPFATYLMKQMTIDVPTVCVRA